MSPASVNQGLLDSVYHLGQTTFPFESGDQATDAGTITTVATYAADNSPNYTFVNTSDSFNYNQGVAPVDPTDEEPTNLYLGSDAAGLAITDATPIETSIFDAEGLIYISQAGTYTIDSSQADDAVRVYIGGSGTAGTGTACSTEITSFSATLRPTIAVQPRSTSLKQATIHLRFFTSTIIQAAAASPGSICP